MICLRCKKEFEKLQKDAYNYRYCHDCRRKYGGVKRAIREEFDLKEKHAGRQVYARRDDRNDRPTLGGPDEK
jgi:DNA-directed RNA polymerase subunit RPC12/RpoP